jgi:TolB protein
MKTGIFLLALFAPSLATSSSLAQTGNEWLASAWQLWRINVDGSELNQLTTTPGFRCGSPDWSPDGQCIAFDVIKSGQAWDESQIGVIHADGSDCRMVGAGGVASWSPDGKLIACQSNDTPHVILVMNRDGTGREAILDHDWSPRWSPAGDRIAAAKADGTGITFIDLATGNEQEVFSGPFSLRHGFSISPDGNHICFASTSTPGLGLATLDDSSSQAKISWPVKTGVAYHSSWSPDGRRIVFAWRPTDQDLVQLYTLDIAADQPPQLLPGQDSTRNNVNPDWSPDGKVIVFSSPAPL